MKKQSLCMLLALAALPLLAQADTGSVTIVSPADNATLKAMAENKISYDVTPGPQGDHTHLYVDGKEIAVLRELKGSYALKSLTPGASAPTEGLVAAGSGRPGLVEDSRPSPTLERFADVVTGDSGLVGVFGSYDDAPEARGLLSEYRNLLHRYVHLRGAGEAETFWAGCGAIRRDAFEAVGGFDTARFPRPQIEDIELGYRLRERGGRIRLDPSIQGTHLKRWSLWPMFRTDFRDRGVPWMRLLMERRGRTAPGASASSASAWAAATPSPSPRRPGTPPRR